MLVWSVDCRGWDLAEQIISSVLHSTGVNPYALVVKQKIILMFNVMAYNVTIISACSDLHGLNHKYNKKPKEIQNLHGGRPAFYSCYGL